MHPAVVIPLIATLSAARIHTRGQEIDAWLQQLSAPEQDRRMVAQRELMGLSRHELPLLKKVIAEKYPRTASIAIPVEEIVKYVVVRDALRTLPQSKNGFLGVNQSTLSVAEFDERDRPIPVGVEVVRTAGTPAFRYLEEGDVIQAISNGGQFKPMRTFEDLRRFIGGIAPGDVITVRVQRGAKTVEVALTLDAKPIDDFQRLQITLNEAEYRAETYWMENFSVLINGPDVN